MARVHTNFECVALACRIQAAHSRRQARITTIGQRKLSGQNNATAFIKLPRVLVRAILCTVYYHFSRLASSFDFGQASTTYHHVYPGPRPLAVVFQRI